MPPKILLVDDEPDTIDVLRVALSGAGFALQSAADGVRAVVLARDENPDLIILDVMMPELTGFEVCRIIRRDPNTSRIPIVLLTARSAVDDRILGFEAGADDYITKPFSPRELVLRVRSVLARTRPREPAAERLRFGELEIDHGRHQVRVGGTLVELTALEFKLLACLARKFEYVQSREQLLVEVWGHRQPLDSRTIDTHVRRLREKLGEAADIIETVRGFGYRLKQGS